MGENGYCFVADKLRDVVVGVGGGVNGTRFRPMNSSVTPCEEAADAESLPCSCQDCASACVPVPPYPPPPPDTTVFFHLHLPSLLVSSRGFFPLSSSFRLSFPQVSLGVMVVCAGFLIARAVTKSRGSGDAELETLEDEEGDEGRLVSALLVSEEGSCGRWERWGGWVEWRLESLSAGWGAAVTRRPFWVLVSALLVAAACSSGIFFRLELTTDPVVALVQPRLPGPSPEGRLRPTLWALLPRPAAHHPAQ